MRSPAAGRYRPLVTAQVLPFSVGKHPAMAGSFVILEFPAPDPARYTWKARPPPHIVAIRDSKHREGPVLVFTPADWAEFTTQVRTGTLHLH